MQKQDITALAHIAVERAVDELRRQNGITVTLADGTAIGYYPAEFMVEYPGWRAQALAVTAARADALGLAKEDSRIAINGLSEAQVRCIADPVTPVVSLPVLQAIPADATDKLALALAKQASLLPALLRFDTQQAQWQALQQADIERYYAQPLIDIVPGASAALPIEGAEQTTIYSFRARYGTAVHLALVVGNIGDAPLTRIHSSCVTGDILGSLRCDCGDQLKLAMQRIITEGSGILVYLHQEGRGIGITNKLRAYQLQQQGVDTYTANLMLGFGEDERDFSIAAAILEKLGVRRIRMLTNNPHKMAAIEKAGVTVSERVALTAPGGQHNHVYLDAKAKSGHLL